MCLVVRIMDDVLSQGADREPGRWPRRVAAIVAVVVLATGVARNLPHGSDATARHPVTAVTAGPVQLAGLGSSAARLLNGSGKVIMRTLPLLDLPQGRLRS